LACSAGWLGVARAESGALHTVAAAGLKMDVDTRWVSGGGYRPVRITVTPSGPVIADRTLTVEFCTSHFWNYSRDGDLRVVQYVEIPSGSGVVESTISVPQTAAWNRYQVNVFENGKLVPRLSPSGAGDQNNLWAWEEKCPKVLVVGDKLPDTSGLGGLLNVQDYYQYYPYAIAQSGPGGPNVPGGKMPLPTAIARPAADLPRRWIDYTNLDLVCVSVEQLAGLAERHPEALRAILEWTAGGGNLVVYGVGRDWSGLAAVESLTGLAPGREDTSISPTARGWSEPDERRFGRPLAGIGTNATSPLVTPMYTGYGVVAGGGRGTGAGTMAEALLTVEEKEEIPPEQLRPEGCLPFVFRPFNMGMIVAIADDDPFDIPARRGRLGWSWVLNTLGSKRFLWYQRHGVSPTRENPDFWTFLIPGVGLAPITGFRVLITLFVLAIGPLNYVLLRRWKSLHLLVVTVPLSAAAVTLALFGYALVADGLGTRVRVRSITQIDQARGEAACWSRLSFYCGLTPFGGLRFPDDVAVIPLEYLPGEDRTRNRELIWEGDQRLVRGWLPSRTPTQFITARSRPTKLRLAVTETASGPETDSGQVRVENRLGTPIAQLLVRAKSGEYYWAENVETGASAGAKAIDPADAKKRLESVFRQGEPALPAGMDPRSLTRLSGWRSSRRPWYWVSNQADSPPASQRSGLLETSLSAARAAVLEPGSYAAVVERSPEVVVGSPSAREEAGFHVILGTW
jgi:hypothetical protein